MQFSSYCGGSSKSLLFYDLIFDAVLWFHGHAWGLSGDPTYCFEYTSTEEYMMEILEVCGKWLSLLQTFCLSLMPVPKSSGRIGLHHVGMQSQSCRTMTFPSRIHILRLVL